MGVCAIRFLAIVGVTFLISCSRPGDVPAGSEADLQLPPDIRKFKATIAGMNHDRITAAAIAQFGPPTRDVGSGIHIYEWYIDGGVLSVNYPTFTLAHGKTIWLVESDNFARENLLQDFEMTTPPDPANHGTRFWIGDVHISPDGSYRYIDSNSNLQECGDQSNNFFINHPQGNLVILWQPGVNDQTRLETLGETTIATMRFTAMDGKATLDCNATSSEQTRRLSVSGPHFVMDTGWLRWRRK